MRKFFLLFSLLLLFFIFSIFFSATKIFAFSSPDNNACYYCPEENGATFDLYSDVGTFDYMLGPACQYRRDECTAPGACTFSKAAREDNACEGNSSTCNNFEGCTSTPPEENKCVQIRGTLCVDNKGCLNEDTNKCNKNYCVYEKNGVKYQVTQEYFDNTGKDSGTCKYSASPPESEDFSKKATSGMTCDKASDCLSGVCESGKCDNENLAPRICAKSGDGYGCRTAIGYFYADPERFSQSLLRVLLGLSGGILLVLIIFNGYKIMTSQGDPEKIKDAREGIIAAIAGILLIIFSLSILQLITVDIIGIPGFR